MPKPHTGQPVRIPAKRGIGVSSVGPIADEAAILGVLINPIFGGGPCLDTSAK